MNDVLSKKKAAADSSLRFDEYYKALSQYVSALGSPELEAIGAALRQDALQSLSNGAVALAVAQDAVSRLLGARQAIDAAESSGADEIYQRGVESVGGVAAQLIAPALDAVLQLEPLETPDALGGICSNLALTVTNLRLWPQVLVSSLAACMFSSSLRAKNVARYVVAARHLGVEMEPPAKFTDDSLRSLLARIDAERQGRFDFTLLAKGGANTPIAEYRAVFAIQTSEGRGHGLFATAPIAAGQTIICEHAVGYSNLGEDVTGLAALQRLKLSTALNCTGFEMRRVAHLYDGTVRSEMVNAADYSDLLGVPAYTPLRFFTPEVVPQSVDHLAGALKFNAYTGEHYVEQLPNDWLSIGLFPTLALVNHDVVPNVTRQCYGRFLVVRATRPIAAGEEIVGTYVTALAYLVEDNPLDRWVPDVPMKRPPEVLKLRALDDKLGATLEKLTAFTEATSAGLLERVELPARRAFTCNAGLFAAMTKADQHPALIALLDLLASEAPDLSVLEQCAKITHKYERKMNKAMVQKIRSLLEPWCMICLGHANVIAAGSRNV